MLAHFEKTIDSAKCIIYIYLVNVKYIPCACVVHKYESNISLVKNVLC